MTEVGARATEEALAKATPVMKQFFTAKAQHPDALLFFRMGDFYELFYEDATIAARAIDLTLTSRNKGAADEIPMAGVPHHSASQYIQRLLDLGHKVAICEQMADPSKVKGIVPREVVRVVSPGIVYDDSALAAGKNHFLGAMVRHGSTYGLAALDLTTGEMLLSHSTDLESAVAELSRWDPRELLLYGLSPSDRMRAEGAAPHAAVRAVDAPSSGSSFAPLGTLARDVEQADPAARLACHLTLDFAQRCEPGRTLPIERVVVYELSEFVAIDESTQMHLELVRTYGGDPQGSLLSEIDQTATGPGARLLRRRLLSPRRRVDEIRHLQDRVEFFIINPGLRGQVRTALQEIADIGRLTTKIATLRVTPRELGALRRSLVASARLGDLLGGVQDTALLSAFDLDARGRWLDACPEACALLERGLADTLPMRVSEGGVLRTGFDRELDEARGLLTGGQKLIAELEGRLRDETQIPSLKVKYTRVFGWYLEVTRTHLDKAPTTWRRKQTIATGERFTCDELDDLADRMVHAEERSAEREGTLYVDIVQCLAKEHARLFALSDRIAEIDVAAALAEIAHREDWARPEVDASLVLSIEDGRHPVVEKYAAKGRFVPNDVLLDATRDTDVRSGGALWLITGPNMAGKSTLMRQTALIVLLAQMGSFVPARRAHIGVVDRILTRVGANDNLSRGESTFMVEMKETANVLQRATPSSLVILDEIGRGTSTYDGLAIAWAVAEYLHDVVGCRAMFATHYHELTELAASRGGVRNFSVSAKEYEGEIVFFHKVQEGAASRSYGVACAKLAGLPETVLLRARTLLEELEHEGAVGSAGMPRRRGRTKNTAQMDLFSGSKPPDALRTTLKNLDVDRVTPLEALQLLAQLKELAEPRGE